MDHPKSTITVSPLTTMSIIYEVSGPAERIRLERKFMNEASEMWKNLVGKRLDEMDQADADKKARYEILSSQQEASFEKEKCQLLKRIAKLEKETVEVKTKQWCRMCLKESQFYCCWNTSYCGYECQAAHWSDHASCCTQEAEQESAELCEEESAEVFEEEILQTFKRETSPEVCQCDP